MNNFVSHAGPPLAVVTHRSYCREHREDVGGYPFTTRVRLLMGVEPHSAGPGVWAVEIGSMDLEPFVSMQLGYRASRSCKKCGINTYVELIPGPDPAEGLRLMTAEHDRRMESARARADAEADRQDAA